MWLSFIAIVLVAIDVTSQGQEGPTPLAPAFHSSKDARRLKPLAPNESHSMIIVSNKDTPKEQVRLDPEYPVESPTMSPGNFPICLVCENQSLTVGNANLHASLLIPDYGLTTCEKVEAVGLSGNIDPSFCPSIQNQTKEICNCTLPAPTSILTPTTQAPSANRPCYLCNFRDVVIGNPYLTFEFPGTGVFSCNELFVAGHLGLLNSTFCATVNEKLNCSCSPWNPNRSPFTIYPLYHYPTSRFPVCYKCPNSSINPVTFYFARTVVDVLPCGDPKYQQFGGYLDPGYCSLVENEAKVCICQSGLVPSYASAGHPSCYVCRRSSLAVGNPNLVLTLPAQLPASCLELQNAGLQGYIDPAQCPYFQDQVEQNCNCTLPPPSPAPVVFPTFPPVTPPTFPPVAFPFWFSPLYPPRPAPYLWPVVPPTFVTPVSAPPTYPNGGPTSTPSELGALTTAPTSAAPVTLTPVVTPTSVPVLTVSAEPANPTSPTLGPASAITPTSPPTLTTPVTTPPVSSPSLISPTSLPTIKAPVIVPPSPSPSVRGTLILGPKKTARKGGMSKLSSGFGGAAGRGH